MSAGTYKSLVGLSSAACLGAEQNHVFTPIADELTPLVRQRLVLDERLELIKILKTVSNAYGEASGLQVEAVDRLKPPPDDAR